VRGGILKDNFKDEYETLARVYGVAYVPDVLRGLIGQSDLMYDAIHPNDDGYQIISGRIEPVITNLIK
jgi:lysophospholipase L1-like esterase